MREMNKNQFFPNYVSPPGDTLLETLKTVGMTQAELATRTGRPKKHINEIIKGKVSITPEMAIQFERALRIPASFWNNRECNYKETLARLEELGRLESQLGWLDKFPIRTMIRYGWVKSTKNKAQQLKELLNYFGVAAPNHIVTLWDEKVAFRKSQKFRSDWGALIAWLRRGEIEAQEMDCAPYSSKNFRQALSEIRTLTRKPARVFQPEVIRLSAQSGIAVIFVPELPKTRVSGATQWITANKAIIQLSLRYKRDDQLWFTLFHEAGHILLHGKKDVFVDEVDSNNDEKEIEANEFAATILIPPSEMKAFIRRGSFDEDAIMNFAGQIGIAPGIVVGRLQHDGVIPYSYHNGIKRRLVWAEN